MAGSRRAAEQAFLAELHPSELRDEELTAAAWRRERVARQPAREREAAERADQRSFLVGEVDRLERRPAARAPRPGRHGGPRAHRRRRGRRRTGRRRRTESRCEPSRSVRAAGSRARRTAEWLAAPSILVSSPAASARSRNQARAARCDAENVSRSSPPSGVAPIAASASKSARRRSASTRSTMAAMLERLARMVLRSRARSRRVVLVTQLTQSRDGHVAVAASHVAMRTTKPRAATTNA